MVLIGYLGRYGGIGVLPEWWDLVLVIVFSLAVHYTADDWPCPPKRWT